jgi:bifunctional UDP-N-acetylglucosamine pyrophosphorylase/glucosamine-1-phosphate N-acetyltransferase
MVNKVAVVLAGGMGTRMKSSIPKILHRVCGREMFGLVVDAVSGAGFDDIIAVVPPESDKIREVYGESVRYAVQPTPSGTGHALSVTRHLIDKADMVLVVNGDVPLISSETVNSVMDAHVEGGAWVTLLTSTSENPSGMGRIVRDGVGRVSAVVEDLESDTHIRSICEVNAGVYCFNVSWLLDTIDAILPSESGEIYLTDLISIAARQNSGMVCSIALNDPKEGLGVNSRVDLAKVESVLRNRICVKWMLSGVTIPDPSTVYIDATAEIGRDTIVLPNSHIVGNVVIGRDCEIGPNSVVKDSKLGDSCVVLGSVISGSELERNVHVGSFSSVRSGSHLGCGVQIGTSAEVKNSKLGSGTKSGHFSYIGDADVGSNVNIGAGTVTCNYDGFRKNVTKIEDGVMIGSDTMLVAPITVGANAKTGAGSVVTRDVPADALVKGMPARVIPNTKNSKLKIIETNFPQDDSNGE